MKDECDFQLLLHFKRVYPSNKALFHLFLYVKVMNIHDKTLLGRKGGRKENNAVKRASHRVGPSVCISAL